MVSLWGSQKKNTGETQPSSEHDNMSRPSGEHEREPTETDRLLPQTHARPRQDGYLDPDDPAVRELRNLEIGRRLTSEA